MRFCGKWGGCETVAHHFKDFLSARLDDLGQLSPRHEARRFAVLAIDGRYGNHVAFIRSSGQHTAIERFDSLGVMHTRTQAACNIERHMPPADRKAVGMDETPIREYRRRGGPGAHIDHGSAEI